MLIGSRRGALIAVNVLNLGRLQYTSALKVQNYIRKQLLFDADNSDDGNSNHTLILVEHNPVYTLGFREKIDPQYRDKLEKTGAEVIQADRGGLTTFHGPGQLVAYPVFHLEKFHRTSLRNFVASLEHVAVHTCRMMGVPAKLSLNDVSHTGAWANDNKICAIGVHCRRHVTTHGLALNCNVDLSWYKHIVPCGIKDKGVTSLSEEVNENITVEMATSQFLSSFESVFRCKLKDVSDDNALDILNNATNDL